MKKLKLIVQKEDKEKAQSELRQSGFYIRGFKNMDLSKGITISKVKKISRNMYEFGGSAMICKSFRKAFEMVPKNMIDVHISNKIMTKFKIIMNHENIKRLPRPILLSKYKDSFYGIEFNSKRFFSSIFTCQFKIIVSNDRTSSTITIESINILNDINIKKGATHFRILNGIGIISDHYFDDRRNEYYPVEDGFDGTGNVSYSDYLEIGQKRTESISIKSELQNTYFLKSNVSLIQGIGIEFYQKCNDNYFPLVGNSVFKIVKTF